MQADFHYGHGQIAQLNFAEDANLSRFGGPDQSLDDPTQTTVDALAAPLGYPPLVDALVPGDRVTVVLDDGLPQLAEVVAGVVRTLVAGGVEPNGITLLQSPAAQAAGVDPCAKLDSSVAALVQKPTHDPEDADQLSFLAASRDNEPIELSRAICDADLVLPVSCVRAGGAFDARGPFGAVFPSFSNAETIARYRDPHLLDSPGEAILLRQETDTVGWLLGSRLLLQVTPGARGQIHSILAGDLETVTAESQALCEAAWACELPHNARLVVAGIDGDAGQQTWDNFARALFAAAMVVDDEGGAIALCTELDCPTGEALSQIVQFDDPGEALGEILKLRSPDAWAAAVLCRALARGSVFLLSRLGEETVEMLGVAHIASATELARLASRFDSCTLLEGAQHLMPSVVGQGVVESS